MKNLIFALAFMLIGTFTFANTEDNSIIDENKIESLINVDNLELEFFKSEIEEPCGFEIFYDTAETGTGSFWYDCTNDNSGNSNILANFLCNLFWDGFWC